MMLAGSEFTSAFNDGTMPGGLVDANGPLMQVLAKQDAILGAVKKQNQQQSILNKITILTQSIMGYNQEISILRSTDNDIENRILTVEMKIAETPGAEESLRKLVDRHEVRKSEVNLKIKALEGRIEGVRSEIDAQNETLKSIDCENNPEIYASTAATGVAASEVVVKTNNEPAPPAVREEVPTPVPPVVEESPPPVDVVAEPPAKKTKIEEPEPEHAPFVELQVQQPQEQPEPVTDAAVYQGVVVEHREEEPTEV